MIKYTKLFLVFTFFFLVGSIYSYAEIIPPDRRINWNPGIPGGIPTRTTIFTNVTDAPYNAVGNGIADDTNAIQNAINDCPDNQVVYVPTGIYRVTSTLSIRTSIVLRGAGPSNTTIRLDTSAPRVFVIGGYDENNTPINVIGGYTKGSTSITVQNASNLSAGEFIIITQLDTGNSLIDPGNCTWFKRSGRSMGQIIEITAINGNIINIDPGLYYTYENTYDPEIEKSRDPIGCLKFAGIEDMHITRSVPAAGQGDMILMHNCAYCWVKNVESYRVAGRHISVERSFRCVIRDSFIHHAWVYTSGGLAYGVSLRYYTSDCLVENNIFYNLNNAVFLENTGGGNVVAYNYSDGIWLDEGDGTWQLGDIGTHCSYPYMDLIEGNMVTHITPDYVHGGAGYLTFLRNYADGDATWDLDDPDPTNDSSNRCAFEIRWANTHMNIVGNVLLQPGDTGIYECNTGCPSGTLFAYKFPDSDPNVYNTALRHGNFDYINNSTIWDTAIADQVIPNSYYLSGKPSWWDDQGTGRPWPSIGPDISGYVIDIPAKDRFDGETYSGGGLSAPTGLRIVPSS